MATGKTKGVDHKYIGSLTVPQIRRLTLQVQAAMLDIEKEIAKATKGIDPTREKDIQFAVANMVSKWHSGEKKPPQSVFKLNMLLRAAPDKESRGLQIASTVLIPRKHAWAGPLGHLIPFSGKLRRTHDKVGEKLSISGKRDFTKTLLINKNLVGNPQAIYETLDKLNQLHRTLNDIQGTKYSKNIDTNILSEYGIKLDANKGSMTPVNAYYLSSRDLSLKGAHIVDRDKARDAFKADFPLQYFADPGGFRANLDERNYYYKTKAKNNTEGDQYGPLNIINGKYTKKDFQGNWRKGEQVWSGRGSGRSFSEANADTRALLIKKGANPRQVNLLSNDDLSRYRISGGLESKGRLQLLGDNRISLKLDKNRQFNYGDYGITNDMSGNVNSTVLPKTKEELTINNDEKPKSGLSIGEKIKSFEKKLSNSFSEPLK